MKRTVNKFVASFLTLFFPFTLQAEIFELDSVKGLISYFENIQDPSTLAIFDVDMVLLISQESYFRMPTLKKHHAIYKAMTASLTPTEKDMMLMYMLIDTPLIPLDEKMLHLISALKEKRIPTIAFTASLTGALERLTNSAQWRIYSLEYAGFNFNWSFPTLKSKVFNETFPKYAGSYPFFDRGILFANGGHHGPTGKGAVLVAFLNYVNSEPGENDIPLHIIMVDDRKENLLEIEASLKQHFPRIQFTGIHFTAANHVAVEAIHENQFKDKMVKLIEFVKLNTAL